jgi:hypothetical protein
VFLLITERSRQVVRPSYAQGFSRARKAFSNLWIAHNCDRVIGDALAKVAWHIAASIKTCAPASVIAMTVPQSNMSGLAGKQEGYACGG